MNKIEPYIQYVEQLTFKLGNSWNEASDRVAVEAALNGELSKTLRNLVEDKDLQEAGAFFTGESMADNLIGNLNTTDLAILDSACGGGNLLLAAARKMPIRNTLIDTLTTWGKCLRGIDLHPEFVRATRARLLLLAILRGTDLHKESFLVGESITPEQAFPHIFASNSLVTRWPEAEVYLLNPPFNLVPVPDWCNWATGRVCQAALFIIKCLEEAETGSTVKAILPDVLRSGSRYNKWRKRVARLASVEDIEILGQFDKQTQVDVFVLTLKVGFVAGTNPPNWLLTDEHIDNTATIGMYCDVKVGRVVPHRDPETGPLYPYFDVNCLPQWLTIYPGANYRQFEGSTFTTPFVVVRRNSRAKDAHRAVGTIVRSQGNVDEQIAIENHLMIIKPKPDSPINEEDILRILSDPRTTEWLNKRIRCRHLTVSSLQSIPFLLHE